MNTASVRAELERPPPCTNEPHPSTTTTSRFAFANEEELSKLAERATPTNTKQLPTVDSNYYRL